MTGSAGLPSRHVSARMLLPVCPRSCHSSDSGDSSAFDSCGSQLVMNIARTVGSLVYKLAVELPKSILLVDKLQLLR